MLKRFTSLLFGLFLFAIGIVCTINSTLGTSPWDVLHIGLTNYVALSLGQVNILVGVFIVLLSIYLKVYPGWGTIFNMIFIGLFVDLIIYLNIIPVPTTFLLRAGILVAGTFIIAWGTYFYLTAALGVGPRDSLMIGLMNKYSIPVWKARISSELTVTLLGFLLGGPFGLGTIAIAMGLGPAVQTVFSLMGIQANHIEHRRF